MRIKSREVAWSVLAHNLWVIARLPQGQGQAPGAGQSELSGGQKQGPGSPKSFSKNRKDGQFFEH